MPPNPNELHMAAFRPALRLLPPGVPRTSPGNRAGGSGLSRLTVGGAQPWYKARAVNTCGANHRRGRWTPVDYPVRGNHPSAPIPPSQA